MDNELSIDNDDLFRSNKDCHKVMPIVNDPDCHQNYPDCQQTNRGTTLIKLQPLQVKNKQSSNLVLEPLRTDTQHHFEQQLAEVMLNN